MAVSVNPVWLFNLCKNLFVTDYDATIENSYRKQVTVDEEVSMLDILDTAGQEDYAAMRDQYIRTGQGFILVYSCIAKNSFNMIQGFYDRITLVKESEEYPVIIVGNKADLTTQRQVEKSQGEMLAAKLGPNVKFYETSAKTRMNIEESFTELVRMLRRWHSKNKPAEEETQKTDSLRASGGGLSADKKKKKSFCILL